MRHHFPEYFCEFLGTAVMMFIGIGAVALMWAAGSPMAEMSMPVRLRLLLTGTLFAGGIVMVVYSRLGQRSGAHINPAVTLAFWSMGKIAAPDAIWYVVAQVLGAIAGVYAIAATGGNFARSVQLGLTTPGPGIHPLAACGAELLSTFLLVLLILEFVNRPKLAPRTGFAAGLLIALLVMLEGPISGTSLNPARSFAPALAMWNFQHHWLYWVGPPLGALAAVGTFRVLLWKRQPHLCAKLYHTERYSCIFNDCGYHLVRAGETLLHEGEPAERAFYIERGEVEVRKRNEQGREVTLARLGPGNWVGEMGLLLNQTRSASLVAVTDAQLRPVTRENFAHVIGEHPEAALEVMRQLAERLSDADRRMVL